MRFGRPPYSASHVAWVRNLFFYGIGQDDFPGSLCEDSFSTVCIRSIQVATVFCSYAFPRNRHGSPYFWVPCALSSKYGHAACRIPRVTRGCAVANAMLVLFSQKNITVRYSPKCLVFPAHINVSSSLCRRDRFKVHHHPQVGKLRAVNCLFVVHTPFVMRYFSEKTNPAAGPNCLGASWCLGTRDLEPRQAFLDAGFHFFSWLFLIFKIFTHI